MTGGKISPLAIALAGGIALAAVIVHLPTASAQEAIQLANAATADRVSHPREKTFMKRQWGVEVLFVRRTAGGYMLEFRYKVLDPDKAKPLFERRTKPVLTHARTGARMIVPTPAKTGALRNSNLPLADHTYWMFFANPGRLVQAGEQVNIEIGDFLASNIVVQ